MIDGRPVHYSTSSANRYPSLLAQLYKRGATHIRVTDRRGALVMQDRMETSQEARDAILREWMGKGCLCPRCNPSVR